MSWGVYFMKHKRNYYKSDALFPMLFMISIPILNIFYYLLNNSQKGAHSLVTDIDILLPFSKVFILPYAIFYPFMFFVLTFLCMKKLDKYYTTLISLDIVLVLCYITYYFFQTTVPRPELIGNDILTNIVRFVYKNDYPFNCFPSIHVAGSFIMIKGINSIDKNKTTKILVTIVGTFIILSTQFIKQHVLLDLLSAILISEAVFHIVALLQNNCVKLCKDVITTTIFHSYCHK